LKKKFVFIYVFVLINALAASSQAISSGNLYCSDPYLLNPAFAGYKGALTAHLNFKQTSASFEGAPVLLNFGIHSPIYRNMSLGGRFYKQSEGLFDNLSVLLDYSYFLKLNNSQSLRFGLATGIKSNQMDYSRIIAEDPSAIIDVAARNFEGMFFQAAAGVAYNWNFLDMSISVPQFFESRSIFKPEYWTFVSYGFHFEKSNIVLKPSLLSKMGKGKPVLFDINLTSYWKDMFYVGIAYRNRPGLIFSAGFCLKDLSFSYAFETSIQKSSNLFDQIHEISISYSIAKKKSHPVDTTMEPDFPFLVKKDSLKSDSLHGNFSSLKDSIHKDIANKADSVKKNSEKDSLSLIKPDKKYDVDKYDVIDIGDGVYSIVYKNSPFDSIQYSINGDTSFLSNNQITNKLINRIFKRNGLSNDSIESMKTGFYTIKLDIDQSDHVIFRDVDITPGIWFETDERGKFLYYFGHYDTEEKAKNDLSKLAKYSQLAIHIIWINK
jgi:type IX secretion system PorP/SprF family membrane protein